MSRIPLRFHQARRRDKNADIPYAECSQAAGRSPNETNGVIGEFDTNGDAYLSSGNISVNDKLLAVEQIENVIYTKLVANPALIVAFNVDKRSKFEIVDKVMEELKAANATRVSFTADPERKR